MSEYFSKEDISRVLLERIGANESCLSNARKLGNHEGEQYFHNLVFEDEQITSLIEELTTYSFPDREKAISEIETDMSYFCFDDWGNENATWTEIKGILRDKANE